MEPATQQGLKMKPVNVLEYEESARHNLEQQAFDYYAGFSWDGISVRQNRTAYDEIALRPRMLIDVSERNKQLEIFGTKLATPMIIAPMAFQGMAHAEGEVEMACAAEIAGTIMTLSTLANRSIEEVAERTNANLWFQLYVYKDRELTKSLIKRAESAGCKALVVTVDSPLVGRREGDVRNRFRLPPGLRMGNLSGSTFGSTFGSTVGSTIDQLPKDVDDSGLAAYVAALYDPSLTWKDLEWFRSLTSLPILVKGILRGDDAQLAVDYGAAGVVVSNHGGRQLDTAIATIRALPEVVAAVGDKCKILVDGGIRRGTDVLKAIALGADAVMVGRPLLWGLAVDGRLGAAHVLELLNLELDLAMALCGCPSLDKITPDLVRL